LEPSTEAGFGDNGTQDDFVFGAAVLAYVGLASQLGGAADAAGS